MTDAEIALVQDSFLHVHAIQEKAAGLFYVRLFEIDPGTAVLFAHSDMKRQGAKLMDALELAVGGLRRPDTIVLAMQLLGRRHVAYGVTDAQYASVGAALLWTLQQGLGVHYTPAVESAWASAYALLSGTMMAAARASVAESAGRTPGVRNLRP